MERVIAHKIELKTDRELMQFMVEPAKMEALKKDFPPSQYDAELSFETKTVIVYKK